MYLNDKEMQLNIKIKMQSYFYIVRVEFKVNKTEIILLLFNLLKFKHK